MITREQLELAALVEETKGGAALLTRETMKVGGAYNWKHQPDRLIYLGRSGIDRAVWHQFKKIGHPSPVWCEVCELDLAMLEETKT